MRREEEELEPLAIAHEDELPPDENDLSRANGVVCCVWGVCGGGAQRCHQISQSIRAPVSYLTTMIPLAIVVK